MIYNIKADAIGTYILKGLYDYRVLTFKQIIMYLKMYDIEADEKRIVQTMNILLNRDYLLIENYSFDSYAFALTANGHKTIAKNEENIIGKDIVDKYITYANYKFKNNKLFNHQIHLNNIVLQTLQKLKKDSPGILEYIEYYDEKNFLKDSNLPMRPDGVIYYKDPETGKVTFYFLEMDMDTESVYQLGLKWDNYYKLSQMFSSQNNTVEIKMIFIAEKQKRLDLTKFSLSKKVQMLTQKKISFYLVKFDLAANFIYEDLTEAKISNIKEILWEMPEKFIGDDKAYKIKDKYCIPIIYDDNFNNLQLVNTIKLALNKGDNILFVINYKIEDISFATLQKIFDTYMLDDQTVNKSKFQIFFATEKTLKENKLLQFTNFQNLEYKFI